MNHIQNTIEAVDTTTQDSPRRVRSASNKLVAIALIVTIMLGAIALTASPASAAGDTTRPDIYGCFTWGGGVAYNAQPTMLQYWNGSTQKWVTARSVNTTSAGCVRYNDITPGNYYRITAHKMYGYPLCYYYNGSSPYVLTARGDTLYRVGTTYVYGPYRYNC